MADVSTYAESLCRLLNALGWITEASRSTVLATEFAFEPITRTWMVGKASSLTDDEVRKVNPSKIIVEDFATPAQLERLEDLLSGDQATSSVFTYTRFIDQLWGADDAKRRAFDDAEAEDQDALFGETMLLPLRHIKQDVQFSDRIISDHRALQHGLEKPGTWLAVLSDAGLGKTEFLRIHELRYAQLYASAQHGARNIQLPPIALRVSLRDLRSLSLDYIAHVLSQPAQRGHSQVRLPRISSGAVLRELLVQGRLILFLDGLDEVAADNASIETGLLEWHQAVSAGARIVVTSRTGHASARGAITRRFKNEQITAMRPLEKDSAIELLKRRGASTTVASSIYAALSGPAATIPLYLVLANHVGMDKALPKDVRVSKTLVLQTLIEHFCEREFPRLGIDSNVQMDLLDQVAEWTSFEAGMSRDDLLEALGFDIDDLRAKVVLNPHALLIHSVQGGVDFKYPEFGALFMARMLASSWKNNGFDSVSSVLRSKRLDELVIEYLARFIHPSTISGAWVESEVDAGRGILLRRNLLAVAVAKVNDNTLGHLPKVRADELATVLGNRLLTNVSFAGISLERFDFSEWSFKNVKGDDGGLSYCENLDLAVCDESIDSLILEGCSFINQVEESIDYSNAVATLVQLIRPLKRRTGGVLVTLMSVDEARDPLAWSALQKSGVAKRIGKARHAKWELTSLGTRLLNSFNSAYVQGEDVLANLISSDVEIRSLLQRLT